MEIKGKITNVLETQTGTSAKGNWTKQNFVLITEDQYPKSIAFDAFNKDFKLRVGELVNVSINIESREYQGKWFTNISAYKVDVIMSAKNENGYIKPEPIQEIVNKHELPESDEDSQLPF